MVRNFFLILCISIATGFFGYAQGVFKQAADCYDRKEYDQALHLYEKILNTGSHSAALYFNIANCHYRMQRWGKAIVYYLKAKKMDPADPEIDFNLDLSKKKLPHPVEVEKHSFLSGVMRNIYTSLSSDAWGVWVLVFSFCVTICLAVYLYAVSIRSRRYSFYATIVFLSVGVFSFLFGVLSYEAAQEPLAVITVPNDYAKTEPNEQSSKSFVVYEGMQILITSNQNNWVKVSTSDGKIGWLPIQTLEEI